MKKALLLFICVSLVVVWSSLANATLWNRGGGLIYDDVLKITWLQDANYALTSGYWNSLNYKDPSKPGAMTWQDAQVWAAQLEYGGYKDWRLFNANNADGSAPSFGYYSDCEMGQLYYDALENPAHEPVPNIAPFINVQLEFYWSITPLSDYGGWGFYWGRGVTIGDNAGLRANELASDNNVHYVWAVRDGDVGGHHCVPEPATMFLLGSSLFGLFGLRRKFKK